MSESKKSFLGLYTRGLAMGVADVIPGVSGGTIAFITGIYEELLETISKLKFGLLKTWKTDGFKAMWKEANFSFLFSLLAGIFTSIASLAILIEYLLARYPIQIWSFFFGLILASVWLMGKTVKKWNFANVIGLIAGTVFAYWVTIIAPTEGSESLLYIFICGSIAICAMILPGISGSFILLLLGAYFTVLGSLSNLFSAIKDGNWDMFFINASILVVFAFGCLVGIISFSKLLNWLFKKAHDLTIAILTGFLVGSLNKIWPWKEVLEYRIKHAGEPNEELVPVVEKNISPNSFVTINGEHNYLLAASLFAIVGIILIILLDRVGNKKETK